MVFCWCSWYWILRHQRCSPKLYPYVASKVPALSKLSHLFRPLVCSWAHMRLGALGLELERAPPTSKVWVSLVVMFVTSDHWPYSWVTTICFLEAASCSEPEASDDCWSLKSTGWLFSMLRMGATRNLNVVRGIRSVMMHLCALPLYIYRNCSLLSTFTPMPYSSTY